MVPAKLLVGSVVAVGSVSTAAVVAHQQGFFSLPGNQTQETGDTPDANTLEVPEARDQGNPESRPNVPEPAPTNPDIVPATTKPNQEAIKTWLTTNKGNSTWEIKIKKNEQEPQEFKNDLITETDLQGFIDYLNPNTQLLKSLFDSLEAKTLTFKKPNTGWKVLPTKDQIEKWVGTTSSSKASLQISDGSTKTTLESITEEDWGAIFNDLHTNKNVFNITDGSISSSNKKNILFEKVDSNWKHSKTEITNWLTNENGGNNKFSIEIQKGSDSKKSLNEADEENLIGLLKYLKDKKSELFEFSKDSTSLTFKKESTNWEVIHSETTINNWVSNVAGSQTTLELYEGTGKKTPESGEWKTLLDLIKGETELFKKSTDTRKIIFEKTGGGWKHIKKAIKEWLESESQVKDKLTIQIQKEGSNKAEYDNSSIKDEDLIGLLSHLKTNGTSYVSKPDTGGKTTVTLQKKSSGNNEWEKFTAENKESQ